jgi:hypothetical protein
MTTRNQETPSVTVSQTKEPKVSAAERRKAALSPELREVLHMLKSLETELDARRLASR